MLLRVAQYRYIVISRSNAKVETLEEKQAKKAQR
jgi:hypothetical protein